MAFTWRCRETFWRRDCIWRMAFTWRCCETVYIWRTDCIWRVNPWLCGSTGTSSFPLRRRKEYNISREVMNVKLILFIFTGPDLRTCVITCKFVASWQLCNIWVCHYLPLHTKIHNLLHRFQQYFAQQHAHIGPTCIYHFPRQNSIYLIWHCWLTFT